MAVYNPPVSGATARVVSLDLVLKNFMKSTALRISNSKIWDSISKMVPGTTPQQCARRWDELLLSNHNAVASNLSELVATGRPISSHKRKLLMRSHSNSTQPSSEIRVEASCSTDTINLDRPRENEGKWKPPSTGADRISEHTQSEMEKAQDTQCRQNNVLNRPKDGLASEGSTYLKLQKTYSTTTSSSDSDKPKQVVDSPNQESVTLPLNDNIDTEHTETSSNITIKVSDEFKKRHCNFQCPQDILVREMPYFYKYLCIDLANAEISVHCDIGIFEWLIQYAKRGMFRNPSGKQLDDKLSKPLLEPHLAVSILISSYFLKMEDLVEESLKYCHDQMSAVIDMTGSLSCISQTLLIRLATKFSPLELENVVDKKDKIKSKLFLYQLEQLFKSTYSSSECPSNASTLYRCRYCNYLLTSMQESYLPCTTQRLNIDVFGKVIYDHERNPTWNINSYIQALQQYEELTPRDIYWRLWGIVNVLYCDTCHTNFQCCSLNGCLYHPHNVLLSDMQNDSCCYQNVTRFTVLPQQQYGCCCRQHSVSIASLETPVYSILLKLQDIVCKSSPHFFGHSKTLQEQQQQDELPRHSDSPRYPPSPDQQKSKNSPLSCLLQSEQKQSHSTLALNQRRETLVINPTPEHPCISSSTSSCVSITSSKQQQTVSQEFSELEEDEIEDREKRKVMHCRTVKTSKKKGYKYNIHHKQDARSQPAEWIWSSKRSHQWNKDMQRESDERRQNALCNQLSQLSNVGSKTNEATYAGGIFPRLEAQFKTQHATKAMAMRANQSRSHAAGKKRT